MYRAFHVLVDWVLLTWIWDVPQSCLGSRHRVTLVVCDLVGFTEDIGYCDYLGTIHKV